MQGYSLFIIWVFETIPVGGNFMQVPEMTIDITRGKREQQHDNEKKNSCDNEICK